MKKLVFPLFLLAATATFAQDKKQCKDTKASGERCVAVATNNTQTTGLAGRLAFLFI